MELTANIPHPTITDFVTTVRYQSLVDIRPLVRRSMRLGAFVDTGVNDPKPDLSGVSDEIKAALADLSASLAAARLVVKANVPDDIYEQMEELECEFLGRSVLGWSGMKLAGRDIPFAPENRKFLEDSSFRVDGKSWGTILVGKSQDISVFFESTTSATQ